MAAKAAKLSDSAKDGLALGDWLADRAPRVLLAEFANREIAREGKASQRYTVILEELRTALGASASDPTIADVLHRLDGAVWDVAVEHEDRAWFAAWGTAAGLVGRRTIK